MSKVVLNMPMEITNYRLLPIGTAIDRGEIQICPYCGETGVKTKTDGVTYYTHEQRIGLDSKGVQIGWETCPTDEEVRVAIKQAQEILKQATAETKGNPKSAEPK